MQNNIYVIIVTYNGSKWIDKCFGSIASSNVPVQTIVIDNGSSDKTPEIIQEKYPEVKVIKTGKNLGFGKANNMGMKIALENNADFVFLLNQDAWIENDTIERLIDEYESSPNKKKIGILSPVPYNGSGKKYDYIFDKFYKDTIIKSQKINKNTFEIQFINAAAWLIPRKILLEVGGFHPSFFIHGEDSNYIHRINALNKITVINTKAVYYHDRDERKDGEHDISKRVYAFKNRIKTSLFNPNLNLIKSFYENMILIIHNRKLNIQISLKMIFYNIKFLLIAVSNRNIHQEL